MQPLETAVSTNVTPKVRTASQRGLAARRKGQSCQNLVRKAWVLGKLLEPVQKAGADDLIDPVYGLSIEVKDRKAESLGAWVDQSARSALERADQFPGGLIPIVVHKRRGFADPGRWFVTIELKWFFELVYRLVRIGAADRQPTFPKAVP